jgi:hypothetical protein
LVEAGAEIERPKETPPITGRVTRPGNRAGKEAKMAFLIIGLIVFILLGLLVKRQGV